MKHLSLFLAVAGFLCLGIGIDSASAQGNGATSMKSDITATLYNECCDEIIEISGTLHQVNNLKTGKSHINFQKMTATGSNGSTYHGNYVGSSSFTENDDGSQEGSTHIRIQLTSSNGCTFTAHILTSWTWDSVNGYVENEKKYEIECDGDLS